MRTKPAQEPIPLVVLTQRENVFRPIRNFHAEVLGSRAGRTR
jgi:hypothetical protein